MGFFAVVIVALISLSVGDSPLHFWEVVRFLAVGIPLNFFLHSGVGWALMRIVSIRHDPNVMFHTRMFGGVPPEIAAQVAGDPVFNGAKFLLWTVKWILVITVGLTVAR